MYLGSSSRYLTMYIQVFQNPKKSDIPNPSILIFSFSPGTANYSEIILSAIVILTHLFLIILYWKKLRHRESKNKPNTTHSPTEEQSLHSETLAQGPSVRPPFLARRSSRLRLKEAFSTVTCSVPSPICCKEAYATRWFTWGWRVLIPSKTPGPPGLVFKVSPLPWVTNSQEWLPPIFLPVSSFCSIFVLV